MAECLMIDRIRALEQRVLEFRGGQKKRGYFNRFLMKILVYSEAVWLMISNRYLMSRFETKIQKSGSIQIDHCYVLSLERREDRRLFMKEQLKREQISYEILDAIDGQQIEKNTLPKTLVNSTSKRNISLGQIACVLSHYNVWVSMLEHDWEHLLLFEDDTVLVHDFKTQLDRVLEGMPMDYDYLVIGSCGNIYKREIISDHLFMPYNTCCTDGYVISRKGAMKLLKEASPCNLRSGSIDTIISRLIKRRRIKAYHSQPLLCSQQGLFSTDIVKGVS